ncbi:MAG TPA: hypothetical protein VHX62_18085 [Solirubrobacteraceae bacterium]|nr:hypothetical protein [Solirubrobacteraceae bacterium]
MDLELLTVGRISIDLYCGQVGAGWQEATTSGGIVASRLLCSQAMPREAEAVELVEAMPT